MHVKFGHANRVVTQVSLRGEGLSIRVLQIWSILKKIELQKHHVVKIGQLLVEKFTKFR